MDEKVTEQITEQEENKKKRKKLKTWQKWLIGGIVAPVAVFVILFIVLIIFIVKDSERYDSKVEHVETTTTAEDLTFDFSEGAEIVQKTDLTPIPLTLSDHNLENFEKYLDNIEVEYDYEYLYNIDSVYSRYKETAVCHVEKHSRDIRVNGKIDADRLYKVVKANNKKTLETEITKEEYSNATVKKYCRFIADNLPVIFEKYPEIDQDMVCCLLTDLKILRCMGSLSSAQVTKDLILHVNETQTQLNNIVMESEDPYTDVLYHELMHLCHMGCRDIENSKDEWAVGGFRYYDDEKTNPLMWFWLEEGLAEMNKSYCLNVPYSTYKAKIGYVSTVNFLLTIGSDAGSNPLEKINFNFDIENMFALFGAETEEEKKEVIRLMYSIDVLQSELSDFYEVYLEEFGVDLSEDEEVEEDLRMCVKSDIIEDFTKIFFRNLARQVNKGNVTLQDAYYLMKAYESRICTHFSNKYYGYMVDGKHLYNSYLEMQNEFFKALSKDNNFTVGDLQTGFESYSMNATDGIKTKKPNCDLAFLKKDEKQAVLNFVDEYYRIGNPSIKECVELVKQAEEAINSQSK